MKTFHSTRSRIANNRHFSLNWQQRIVAVFMLAVAFAAQAAPTIGPRTNVLRATLANGLRVVIVHNPLAPVVTTEINYLVGSNEAPPGFPGTAHALEHMMFRGSPGLSADQLASITTAMGGAFDADTQQTVTQYFFTVPAEDLDTALHIEAIRMRGVLSTDALWRKERGAIEQEVAQDLSSPQYVFYTQLLAALFKGTPYAHDALGTRPSFNRTSGAMLRHFHDDWYAPNNAILVIAGDIQLQATLAKVRVLFSGIPAKKLPPRPAIHLQPVQPASLNLKTDLPYGLAIIAFRLPGSDSPDYAAAQVLADVLSNQRGKLYGLVPAGKALFAGFAMNALPGAGLGYAVAAFPKNAAAGDLLKEVRHILTATVRDGVSPSLVAAAKRHEISAAAFRRNSVSGLASAWSQALAVEGRRSPNDNVRAIEQVTVADVNRIARRTLNMNHAISAILTPQSSGKPLSRKGFGGKESLTAQHVKPVTLPLWAKKSLGRLTIPKSTVHPTVYTLANGIKLIVQPEAISNTVSVYGHIKNNPALETPKKQEGVADILDQLFSYGTTSLDRLAYHKALDAIGADASAGTDFSLQVLRNHLDRGLMLLADDELHPALPAAAFRIVRRQTAASVAGRLQSPDYLTQRALDAALFPKDDPALRQATPATISALTLAAVKQYYRRVFRPDLTTIVIIGKITPRQAKAVIKKYFGAWHATGPKPRTLLPQVPRNAPSIIAVPDNSRVQDEVTLAETLGLNRYNPDYYALQLGNRVLGGGFYASRLYRDLREKNGLVYYVSTTFQIGRRRAIYRVDYACDPPNVSRARAIIVRDLKAMQRTPVSPHELHQAKAQLLRELPLAEASTNAIAGGLLSRAVLNLPLDEPILAARRYLALNARQVQAAFARWLNLKHLVQVSKGPTPH